MQIYFEIAPNMASVAHAIASLKTWHRFVGWWCKQDDIEPGDDYYCQITSLMVYRGQGQTKKRRKTQETKYALLCVPYKIRTPHYEGRVEMEKKVPEAQVPKFMDEIDDIDSWQVLRK